MPDDTYALRPMTAGDLDAVVVLEPELFGRQAWSRSAYLGELDLPGRHYTVAVQTLTQDVVGYAGIDLSPEAMVMTVGVAPAHQRRGLGRALMHDLLDAARAARSREVHLEVRADDAGAQALYESLGFETIGRRRGYYHGIDALTMRLRLMPRPGIRAGTKGPTP